MFLFWFFLSDDKERGAGPVSGLPVYHHVDVLLCFAGLRSSASGIAVFYLTLFDLLSVQLSGLLGLRVSADTENRNLRNIVSTFRLFYFSTFLHLFFHRIRHLTAKDFEKYFGKNKTENNLFFPVLFFDLFFEINRIREYSFVPAALPVKTGYYQCPMLLPVQRERSD